MKTSAIPHSWFTLAYALYVASIAASAQAGLVGRWDFDAGLESDSSGNGVNLVTNGSPVVPAPGVRGTAASFGGGLGNSPNDPLVAHLQTTLATPAASYNSGFTIALWAKTSALPANAQPLVSHHATGLNTASTFYNGFVLEIYADGSFGLALDSKVSLSVPDGPLAFRSAAGIIQPGQWVHLAATWNGATNGGCVLYVNGAPVAATKFAEPVNPFIGLNTTGLLPLRFGAGFVDSSLTFTGLSGLLDHISLWSDVQTEQALHTDYLATLPVPPLEISPAVVLEFQSITKASYQIQYSSDLSQWVDLGTPIAGNGLIVSRAERITSVRRFYRVNLLSPSPP